MDAPLGVTFFKKVELYQKLSSLDQQSRKMDKKRGLPPLWPLEKKVLLWTYTGHKHLGSPIEIRHFETGSPHSKLEDFGITNKELQNVNITRLLDNFIAHGFATEILEGRLYTGQVPDENRIYITREGLLVGEVLTELKKPYYQFSYWIWSNLWGHLGGFILLIVLTTAFINQLGLNKENLVNTIIKKDKQLICPYSIKSYVAKDYINDQNEIEVVGKPQFINNPSVIKKNTLFILQEFEKRLYKPTTEGKAWESREFDVTGDGKKETIINANTAMNHIPHIALVLENGNIIFEAEGANIWIDAVDNGKGFLLRETVDWNTKDYKITRYIYKDGGFIPIWIQKACGVIFK